MIGFVMLKITDKQTLSNQVVRYSDNSGFQIPWYDSIQTMIEGWVPTVMSHSAGYNPYFLG